MTCSPIRPSIKTVYAGRRQSKSRLQREEGEGVDEIFWAKERHNGHEYKEVLEGMRDLELGGRVRTVRVK